MSVPTEKIKVVFASGNTRVLRVYDKYDDDTVLTRFAGIYMRVRRIMFQYVTTTELTKQQQKVLFGGK